MNTRQPSITSSAVSGLFSLVALALLLHALPQASRLGMATRAAWRSAFSRGTAWSVVKAIVLSGNDMKARLPTVDQAWGDVVPTQLDAPPPTTPPHQAALEHAVRNGWMTCPADAGAPACVALFQKLRTGMNADLAAEAVVLGDMDGSRVKRAVEGARAAGLSNLEDPSVHGYFLSSVDKQRLVFVQRVLGLATLWSLQWPVHPSFAMTSPFGDRLHPVLKVRKWHDGVDLATPSGTPLLAAAPGRVLHVGNDSVSGIYVVVDHGNGVHSVGCHLSEALVQAPQQLVGQQRYASTGATGRVTGPHLHYGVRLAGRFVDPVAASRRATQ